MTDNKPLHEDPLALTPQTLDKHRAIASLMEELEAVDWYDQRFEGANDDELRAILAHNRDEEKEHAAMIIEWLRRNDPDFARILKSYLFADGSIVKVEERETDTSERQEAAQALKIGSLRKERTQ